MTSGRDFSLGFSLCDRYEDLHLLKEAEESVGFQDHAQERPVQERNDHAPQEEAGALELVPLEEEGKRPPQANDEGEAGQEQQLQSREKG